MRHFLKIAFTALLFPAILCSCQSPGIDSGIRFGVSQKHYSVSKDKQTQRLTISSPTTWSITSDCNWVDPGTTGGNSGMSMTVTLSIAANPDADWRTATLTLRQSSGGSPITITVTQNGLNGGPSSEDQAVNEWIYNTLKKEYYWNKAVEKAKPSTYSLPYDDFLENLVTGLKDAKDADGTMDGGYYANGDRYAYSYIDRFAPTRAEGTATTFGFGFDAFYANASQTLFTFLVTWVQPGGPAEGAGLRRGMWINKYNGREITYDDYEEFFYKLHYQRGGTRLAFSADSKEFTIDARTMEVSPVICSKIVKTPNGTDVGYFMYNQFERGPRDGGERNDPFYKFDNEMRSAFAGFRGLNELIVDLRYNLGGYVNCCQVLTSLIADVNSSQVFGIMKYNNSADDETWRYRFEPNSMKLSKVYVLAKGDSASASEMVINSLRSPKTGVEVIHIGEQTEGKNVGMNQYQKNVGQYRYEMWPITFRIYNADNQSDYPFGFTPTFQVNEYRNRSEGIYELGDPSEELLKQALAHIDGGAGAVITDNKFRSTRADGEPLVKAPLPGPVPFGGARVTDADRELLLSAE